jgi:rod shape-determining protein MreC
MLLIGAGLLVLFSSLQDREAGLVTGLVYTAFRPVQDAISGVHTGGERLWRGYIGLVGLHEENRRLQEEVGRLRRERAMLMSHEREYRRLKKLLNLKADYEFPSLVAQVIGEDAAGWYKTFFINRGSEDGVSAGMPATVAEGLVGQVVTAAPTVSTVLLVTDPALSVDCRVGRTRDRGILSGYLNRQCILRYVDLKSRMRAGDEVVTSGMGGVFPRGLAVGKIETVRKDPQGLFLEALVAPAVKFPKIEEVLVILSKRSGFDIRPGLEKTR